jgi:FkbH-like protein
MVDIKSIKLVVWDLDDTFWSGTLSEGDVVLSPDNANLIVKLTDCGIINSICSKNDFEPTKRRLQELGVWDYFVFPSISWDSKGPILKSMLDKMALRPVNVLFLDDNPSNLGEALHYLPDLNVGGPEIIKEIINQVDGLELKDVAHKRLKQYKILEAKDTASKTYSNSEDFLYDSQIRVSINNDCINQVDRIHELILRSNQLNYTKKRISKEELLGILRDPEYDCGYVTVTDRFGDYGLIGFYAKKDNILEHFLFSCRTMGQKIEQWVYAQLNFPELTVVGEVRTILNTNDCPGWINCQNNSTTKNLDTAQKEVVRCNVLLKGPCDMSHAKVYIKHSGVFDTDFTYVTPDEGKVIDMHNHSVFIEGLYKWSDQEKKDIAKDCVFVDPNMFRSSFFTNKYDVIFLSTLIESDFLIYHKKGTAIDVAFGGNDLTDPNNWDHYLNGDYYSAGNHFTKDFLNAFAEKYESIGFTTPEKYIVFLQKCLEWLPTSTTLCLILGATQHYNDMADVVQRHKNLNNAIVAFAKANPRIQYISLDDCIDDSSDYADGINHFSSRVYYNLAQKMIYVIRQVTGVEVQSFSSKILYADKIILKVRQRLKSIISSDTGMYRRLKSVYNKIYKNRQ